MGRFWTDENIEYLKANYGVISASRIAAELRLTRNAVVGKAMRLGLSSNLDMTGKVNLNIRRGVHPGMNRPKVTNTFGVSGQSRASGSGITRAIRSKQKALVRTASGKDEFGRFKLVEQIEDIAIDLPNLWCKPVGLIDLKDHHCRWPLDDGMYCGLQKFEPPEYGKSSYCKPHYEASVRHDISYRRARR